MVSDLRTYFPELFVKSGRRRGTIEKFEGLFNGSRIALEEILAEPAKFLMVFRPSMVADFQGRIPPETVCIYSRWPGYLEQPEWKELQNPATKKYLRTITLHTTGHILSKDIVRFVKELAPRAIVPVHTFEPEEFARRFDNVILPKNGCPFQVV